MWLSLSDINGGRKSLAFTGSPYSGCKQKPKVAKTQKDKKTWKGKKKNDKNKDRKEMLCMHLDNFCIHRLSIVWLQAQISASWHREEVV